MRVQFDRPIATFQVIKHKAADMLHRIELARVGTHYAAWASDVDDPVRAEAAAMAKALRRPRRPTTSPASTSRSTAASASPGTATPTCYYRRAKQNDLLLGYHGWQRQRVADRYLATS